MGPFGFVVGVVPLPGLDVGGPCGTVVVVVGAPVAPLGPVEPLGPVGPLGPVE